MKFLEKLNRIVFGYDFFISYSRKDASNYASNLATEIIKKGYSCYLDQWGSDPGKKLPKRLKSNIMNSSVFILLASNEALQSSSINLEIDIFLTTRRVIIPVNLGNIFDAIWFTKIEGIAISDEKDEFKTTNKTSTKLLERIQNSFIYLKQSKRIKYSALSAVLLIILSLIISLYIFKDMKDKNEKSKKDLFVSDGALRKSQAKLVIQQDSLNKIDDELRHKQEDLKQAVIRQKRAKSLADKFEAQSKNYFSIANEANSNGEKLFSELRELCYKQYKQPNLIDDNQNPNLNYSLAIFYDFDKFNIPNEGAIILENLLDILNQYPNHKVKIETRMSIQWLTKSIFMDDIITTELEKKHLSAGGLKHYYSDAYAAAICNKRAKSIANWLIKNGIEPARVLSVGYGNKVSNEKTMKDYMGDRADIYLVAKN
ncbi:TIR domain-containing protein [Flavobacterium sp. ZS1P14]|uniref:TIR domain-containing protein n=1 Tax=Flavobacterium sp. ZS1P14 TaxID=3401729 RepID=UPI003AB05CB6